MYFDCPYRKRTYKCQDISNTSHINHIAKTFQTQVTYIKRQARTQQIHFEIFSVYFLIVRKLFFFLLNLNKVFKYFYA